VPFLLAAALFGLAAAAADTARLRRADPGARAAALAAADLFPLTAHPYYRRPAHRASWCCGLLVLGTLSIPAVLDMPRELAAAAYLAGIGGQDSAMPAGERGCAPVSCPGRGGPGWADPLPLGRSLPARALIAATGPDPGLFPGFGTEVAVLQLGLVFDGFAALAVLAVLPQARHLARARIRPPRPHLPRRRAAVGHHQPSKGAQIMPADRSSPPDVRAGLALNRAWIIFAITLAPVTAAGAVIYLLARDRILGYWWLAVPLGSAAVPLAVLIAGLGTARRLARDTGARPGLGDGEAGVAADAG
jgi:hypothetical protein